jgi:hypothetical protein
MSIARGLLGEGVFPGKSEAEVANEA